MRLLVFFDLPVKTKRQRRVATQFRNYLLKDGFYMIQYSVYGRVCNGYDDVEKHKMRLNVNVPENGSIRLLVITEKKYKKMVGLVGELKPDDDDFACKQLTIF